jgi:hypothetical protein
MECFEPYHPLIQGCYSSALPERPKIVMGFSRYTRAPFSHSSPLIYGFFMSIFPASSLIPGESKLFRLDMNHYEV